MVGRGQDAGCPGSERCVRPLSSLTLSHPSPAKPGWQCLHHGAPGWREAWPLPGQRGERRRRPSAQGIVHLQRVRGGGGGRSQGLGGTDREAAHSASSLPSQDGQGSDQGPPVLLPCRTSDLSPPPSHPRLCFEGRAVGGVCRSLGQEEPRPGQGRRRRVPAPSLTLPGTGWARTREWARPGPRSPRVHGGERDVAGRGAQRPQPRVVLQPRGACRGGRGLSLT